MKVFNIIFLGLAFVVGMTAEAKNKFYTQGALLFPKIQREVNQSSKLVY